MNSTSRSIDDRPVLRFAPSPNGALHLGHALSALTTADWAQRLGGRLLVRIEDIDPARSREAHIAAILNDLRWLGLDWDEPVLRQSTRMGAYTTAADRLHRMGLLYRCYATRREIADHAAKGWAERDPDGAPIVRRVSPPISRSETDRRQLAGEPCVVRLDMAAAIATIARRQDLAGLTFAEMDAPHADPRLVTADPARWGDVVLQRKDVPTSYHLAVVVDDAYQGITHVTRGQDLFEATHVHRLLQVLLDLPEPMYHHHRLITDEAGRKLSKSRGDTSLASLRAGGEDAASIRRRLGFEVAGPAPASS